jgi:hypothetical protein
MKISKLLREVINNLSKHQIPEGSINEITEEKDLVRSSNFKILKSL